MSFYLDTCLKAMETSDPGLIPLKLSPKMHLSSLRFLHWYFIPEAGKVSLDFGNALKARVLSRGIKDSF